MVEADAAHPVLENSFDASSAGPSTSILLNTLKELQHNQATLASRPDKQDDTNVEFRTWMNNQEEASKKQDEDTYEIKTFWPPYPLSLASRSLSCVLVGFSLFLHLVC